ncbi:nicotinate-nucleotide adenylyltransferase [Zophobihabitans entericus]|uniref:Probable nicotinate-nucleotide adenylyltransferase n=1 Tax=Zophobihabitans entericus TaxID=1635327 RepID=A0A6G9ICP0_9GAMM|nr:nicotinate-nucleotide adenylyltransferase [Zophobihabitans entericus]QIQ21592.1 nicotinate-nucleotide adenylyltransferase [Zophobihabitans entericus]
MPKQLYALFGGTFDPIHNGHLLPVMALAKEVGLTQVNLLPNHIPPHKQQPDTTPIQRVAMLKLAIEGNPLFTIDMRELNRDKPSYTIDTLEEWRKEHGMDVSLAFIIGQDSLLSLPSWQRWRELLNYCHLLVCRRPGFTAQTESPELKEWIVQHQTQDIALLHQKPHGHLYLAHTPLEDISATEIRQQIREQKDYHTLLPEKVWQYIQQNQLYI